MYIINDIWLLIKDFLFHNIKKHGKHLKDDFHIKNYNSILKTLPKKYIPRTGPRIIYYSFFKSNFRLVKFLYHIYHKTWKQSKTIMEYATYRHYYCVGNDINHAIISDDYHNNIK